LLGLSLGIVAGCADLSEDALDDELIEQPTVYAGLNVVRVDQQQTAVAMAAPDPAAVAREWRWLSNMRAVVRLDASCAQPDGLAIADKGSAFLVGPSMMLTADHVVRAWKQTTSGWEGCSPTQALPTGPDDHHLSLQWAHDRENTAGAFADSHPPNRWLLAHRLHTLSLFETGDFDNTKLESAGELPFDGAVAGLEKSFAGGMATRNRDAAIVAAHPIDLPASHLAVPPGLLFDWMRLPEPDGILNETTHKNKKARGIHMNIDPSPTTGGNWNTNFAGPGEGRSTPGPKLPLLSGSGFFRQRAAGTTFAVEPCAGGTATGYGDFCVGNTLDVLAGSSGGAVLFDEEALNKTPAVLAIIQGSFDKLPGTAWGRKSTSYFSDDALTAFNACFATTLDSVILGDSHLRPRDPPSPSTRKAPATARACVGRCAGDATGSMVNFACAEGFDRSVNPTNSVTYSPTLEVVGAWNPANSLGLVGGPTRGNGTSVGSPELMKGVGSLGLVCDAWAAQDKDRSYAEHWWDIQVVGLFRRGDALVQAGPWGKVNRLMDLNQTVPLAFSDADGELRHQPLPMKLCPPNQTLTGLEVEVLPTEGIKDVTRIRCSSVSASTSTWFTTNPTKYTNPPADAAEFIQHIGAPFGTGATTTHALVCNAGEILTGLRMYVPNDTAERDRDGLGGLGIICQGGLF